MTKETLNSLIVWITKLKVKDKKHKNMALKFNSTSPWIVTEFARNMNDDFMYVVQPLMNVDGKEGCSGLFVLIMNEQEILETFDLL